MRVAPLRSPNPAARLLWLVGGLAVALRLATLAMPHAYFPDEIFQYLEQAHRLAFGVGVVPWEYRLGIRNWILPLLLAGPMWLGGWLPGGAYLILPKLSLLLASLAVPWAALSLGRGLGRHQALLALWVAAIWVEPVYFSTQALSEPVAVAAILAGAALLAGNRPTAAGALLALGLVLRFQYGPAIGAFALVAAWPGRHGWTPVLHIVMGGLGVLLLAAVVDIATGLTPFGWIVENIRQNVTLGRSHFMVSGPWFFPEMLLVTWGLWLLPIFPLAVLGARRIPALAIGAAVNLLLHSAIAHKEYRYFLLTTIVLALLAAIGTAEAITWLARDDRDRARRLLVVALAGWGVATVEVATGGGLRGWWYAATPALRLFIRLRDDPGACGIALDRVGWPYTGGYSYLHRPLPMYIYGRGQHARLMVDASAFNRVVGTQPLPRPFRLRECLAAPGQAALCVFARPGGCAGPSPATEINHLLRRTGR